MLGSNLGKRIQRRTTYIYRRGLWAIRKHFVESAVVQTPTGKFAVYLKDEIIGLCIILTRQYDTGRIRQVFQLLRTSGHLPPGEDFTMIDIGANIGVIGLQALTMGLCQRVIAIEPDPKNFALLKKNIELNQLTDRVRPLQLALSNQSGSVMFELDKKNFGDHRVHTVAAGEKNLFDEADRTKIEVQARRLNDVIEELPATFRKIDIGWMDIQGFEGLALTGGDKVFSLGFPMMIEVSPYLLERAQMTDERFLGLLTKYWSHFFVFEKTGSVKKSLAEFSAHYRALGNDGRYDDFLFVKES